MKNPYETLGVESKASQEEIKNAYRALAKKFHPDLNPGDKSAERRFKEINAAYELVGDAESRAKFDRGEIGEEQAGARAEARGRRPFYHETQSEGGRYTRSFGGMDDDWLNSIFGRMGGAERKTGFNVDVPGGDTLYRLDVPFRDAVRGAEREITLANGKRLRVRIPAGVESGVKLRFAGQGDPGTGKAPAGDAYVELNVLASPLFSRKGNDLEIELPVSVSEAILGAEVEVPTLDGSVLLKIPAGVTTGSRLRIAGKGVVVRDHPGDQIVTVKLVSPGSVDADFKKAVEAWSTRQPFNPRAGWPGGKRESHE